MKVIINNEDIYAYILKREGLSNRIAKELCKLAGSLESIISFDYEKLMFDRLSGTLIDSGISNKDLEKAERIKNTIIKKESELIKEARIFYASLINKNIKWTHISKEDYPKRLLNIVDPPLLLFYKGKLPDENKPCVSIIGARECSTYGEKVAEMFSKELSIEGVQIISGMARGIDGISQRNSIKVGGRTFGVLGCGVDIVYPPDNEDIFNDILKDGGLISEFEPGTEPKKQYFPSRNRIISGLSDIVLVVEARKKSGTYITVTQALEQGREVYAVPGRITDGLSDGCNSLIASGAGVAASPDSILEALKDIKESNCISFKRNGYYVNYNEDGSDVIDDNMVSQNFEENIQFLKDEFSETEEDFESGTIDNQILKLLSSQEMSLDKLYYALKDSISTEDLSIALIDLESEGRIRKMGCKYFAI